jgi:hypothetical protein
MVILVLGVIQFAISTITAANSLNVFPPGGKPYGLDYSEHIQNFWKLILAIPANDSPTNDASGERCSTNQMNTNSSVFYLPPNGGGFSERTCKVPVGKGLLIPVMIMEMSDKEMPGGSVEELSKSAKEDQDKVNSLYLNIDNTVYKYDNLTDYRTHTEAFEATFPEFPEQGIFGVTLKPNESGISKVVADGYYIITEPIAKGNHTIHFKSSLSADPTSEEPPFATDVIYHIIAE